MIAVPAPQRMTVEAYLDWEPSQELRHEFVNGSVFAMIGGPLPHNDITINLLTALRPHIRSQGCRINMADAKVNITPQIYRYPDLAISCGEGRLWLYTAYQAGDSVPLESVGFESPIELLYEDVRLEA